jgi:serine/threonine protein kinase, bacterial
MQHPHLLPTHQVWSLPGYIVVAMELGDGSLLELLDAYQIEYQTAVEGELLCRYLTQAADALDYLNPAVHSHEGRRVGWQHCDIKPSNLLLVGDGIKVCDFGLSKTTHGPLTPYPCCGTLDFAAPEIHRNMLSEKSDQYSLAVTYYYLRTGKFPFPTPLSRFDRQYSYTRPVLNLSRVPAAEQKVLERALSTQPEHRWDSCSTMMKYLYDALTNGGSSMTSSICVQATADAP